MHLKKGKYLLITREIVKHGFGMKQGTLYKDGKVIESIRCLFPGTVDRWAKKKEEEIVGELKDEEDTEIS